MISPMTPIHSLLPMTPIHPIPPIAALDAGSAEVLGNIRALL